MYKRFIGDRQFYRRILGIAIPIIIQNGITTFVSLLDNIMVGQVGTPQMSGVSIANQLLMIFNLCVFGINSGAGIFTAQFFGSGNQEGIRYTFRFKILACVLLSGLGIGIFLTASGNLISLYLQGEGDPADAAATLSYGIEYLYMILWGLLPFALSNAYSTTLRETGQTVVPMVGGVIAVLVNLALNYVFIFGNLGAPAMGSKGAALATVISRYVELAVVAGWTHLNSRLIPYIKGVYRRLYIPKALLWRIFRKGLPLLLNECAWALGMAFMSQCYSTCGLSVIPALNIASTIQQLTFVVSAAVGNGVAILMGQMLGAGKDEQTLRDTNRKLLALAVACGAVFGGLLLSISDLFPMLYNTSGQIRDLASQLIRVNALAMPLAALSLSTYFTLRSGGQALITMLFDSCFTWACPVMLALCLSRFTHISIVPLFAICQSADIIKCVIGIWLLKKGIWIRNLTH